jgi:hypothetical protein
MAEQIALKLVPFVLSDRRAQKDRQLEVTDVETGAPEDVRYVGSNPVVPTSFRNEPSGQQIEGHYAWIPAIFMLHIEFNRQRLLAGYFSEPATILCGHCSFAGSISLNPGRLATF